MLRVPRALPHDGADVPVTDVHWSGGRGSGIWFCVLSVVIRAWPWVLAVLVLGRAAQWIAVIHPDVRIAQDAATTLLGNDFDRTYIDHPLAQMGPLPIALSTLPRPVTITLAAALVVPFTWVATRTLAPGLKSGLWCLVTLGLVEPWAQFAWKGHLDDALVLVAASGLILGIERDHIRLRWSAWILGVVSKPTALMLWPLVADSMTALVAAGALAVLLWLPFFLPDPRAMLAAGKGVMAVNPHSVIGELGFSTSAPPGWLRPAQTFVGVAATWWASVVRQPSLGVLLAFTARSAAEPNPAPAYAGSVIALALLADARSRRRLPWYTVLALAAFVTSQPALDGHSGWPRFGCHLALICLICFDLTPRRIVRR